MPYRLELAIKQEINIIDELITILTKLYKLRSYKRKAHLRVHALRKNLDLYDLYYTFPERILGINLLFDLLGALRISTLLAQQSARILIGKEHFGLDLLAFILDLKNNEGDHLIALTQ